MTVSKNLFGVMPDGKEVYEFTLENNNGMKVSVLTLGATLRSIIVPDKNGNADIPASSRPYKPSTEDYEQAMRGWIETGVRNQ